MINLPGRTGLRQRGCRSISGWWTARSLLRAAADRIDGVREFLQAVAEVLPPSEDQEAMFDDQLPMTAVVNMAMAVDSVVRDFLGPPPALLRRTSALTDGDLQRDFDERHAGYQAAQKEREEAVVEELVASLKKLMPENRAQVADWLAEEATDRATGTGHEDQKAD